MCRVEDFFDLLDWVEGLFSASSSSVLILASVSLTVEGSLVSFVSLFDDCLELLNFPITNAITTIKATPPAALPATMAMGNSDYGLG